MSAKGDHQQEEKRGSLGDVLRERGKRSSQSREPDILEVWAEQKRIRRENARLARQYKQTKDQAKALKKKLREQEVGDEALVMNHVSKLTEQLAKQPQVMRLRSIVLGRIWPIFTRVWPKRFRPVYGLALGGILLVGLLGVRMFSGPGQPAQSSEQTSTNQTNAVAGATTDEKPTFSLLFPSPKLAGDYQVSKISPEGNDAAFTYLDELEGAQLRVSQQQLPAAFTDNPAGKLEEVAKNFQATNVIQIDDTKVYHGFSEKTGVQSLVFIKNNLLIFIGSSSKLSDDTWAGYILSLKP